MSAPLLWVVTLIYAFVSLDLYWHDKQALSLVFFGYTIANFGLIWSLK